jgi:hypothetical protein
MGINSMLSMLRQRRTARRDTAQGRLAAARAQYEVCRQRLLAQAGELQEALNGYESVRRGDGMAADPEWRKSMLPSCEALIAVARAVLAKGQAELDAAESAIRERRTELGACERALLRTDELELLERGAQQVRDLVQEQDVDDDLAAGWRPAAKVSSA